ncbi:hydroxyacylglutathione hydrolase [Sphingomonas sp. HT-1]|uniref:hydroxyacylglutathione hydrolase n=1 Tax=unclassified Sphingomonas TaxID=196159 RepID=UPI0003147B18|nr:MULTISPECIES: hydroxyacylglutathione hydrolase [unclassified Sphingomonas]KTF68863.1 hydroxyacylglutathione hydrolase [Sphingomonas sp. WG]
MPALQIVRIPALSDNYVWLAHDPVSRETIVVDPAQAEPVQVALAERGWTLTAIWNTHWHPDHTGGNAGLKAATGCTVIAPAAEAARIPTADRLVGEGDTVAIGAHIAAVLEVPAHTAGHIAYHFADDAVIFVGDTLFAMGCGRLFEGTADQMFANMQRLAALPGETRVYCAHEYTLSNARYALVAEPDNAAIATRMAEVERLRAAGEATVPTTIAAERATNPFLRAPNAAILAERRAAKDSFAG